MKIIKNYLYNASFQIFLLLVPLITTPYVARVLGPNGVGINAFTNSIIQYFVLFGSIGINLYGNREIAYHRDDRVKTSQIFWEIEILRLLAIAVSMLVFVVFIQFEDKYRVYLLMQSVLIIAAAFDISWFFMGTEDFKTTVTRNMVVKLISIVLIFLFIKSSNDIALYILIISGSQLFGNLTLWPYLRKRLVKVSFKELKILRHLRPSLLLFLPQIATNIYFVLNKTMLGLISGVITSGFFDNSDKMIKMVLAIVTATGTVMLPRVANTFARGETEKVHSYLYSTFEFVTFSSVPLLFGLAAIAPEFGTWFFGSKFNGIDQLIMTEAPVILMIAWGSAIGTQYLLPTKQNRAYTISVTIGAVTNLLLNIPFILVLGAIGTAISTVISEAAVIGFQIFTIRKQIDLRVLFSDTWKYLISGLVMFIVVFTLNKTIQFNIYTFIGEVLVGVVIYICGILITQPKILKNVKKILKDKKI
ncbi:MULTISPECIES: oligosaccharide flippase family protein [Lactobacillaceae]|uniref:oligosaccharide flippase family protein n=1 Tax=Lactobacillaceae TaxID=33958 RepID=UPI0006D4B938|nr:MULTISPECIES: oligosaccharide flippase family protein [Lactobacillaceae]ALG27454.1 flippase [Lactiplantibacillus plantarum]